MAQASDNPWLDDLDVQGNSLRVPKLSIETHEKNVAFHSDFLGISIETPGNVLKSGTNGRLQAMADGVDASVIYIYKTKRHNLIYMPAVDRSHLLWGIV